MISNYQKIKILLYSGTETSILDLRVVHGLAGRWQRSGNVFPPSNTELPAGYYNIRVSLPPPSLGNILPSASYI